MSHAIETQLVLGRPDYDVPLVSPVAVHDGLAVTGHDGLGYLWRFAGERASLWALDGGVVGRSLGEVGLGRPAPDDAGGRCGVLREAQAHRREVQAAYVQLTETLLSMAGDEPGAELRARLHAIRLHCGDALLMFTDPADEGAHGEFRLVPEIASMANTRAEERDRLRPLARTLLEQNGAMLGVEDGEGLLALLG